MTNTTSYETERELGTKNIDASQVPIQVINTFNTLLDLEEEIQAVKINLEETEHQGRVGRSNDNVDLVSKIAVVALTGNKEV